MMLSELTPVPEAALPLAPFKAHLRLGSGFGEDSLQDEVLIGFLRAALAAIEGRTGKALIIRDFEMEIRHWRDRARMILPIAPVQAVTAVAMRGAGGDETVLDASLYHLEPDSQRPRLCPAGSLLPPIPTGGLARISLQAGMASDWGGLPADLGQAVMLLAAHYYEYRADTGLHGGCMPFGVTSLIERYRSLRLTLGGLA
ncbi:head-tail connector protein [Leisingera methylohalidivorans]|uniref:Gene transfer agent protein n=1 Tax=Leisingera methylohalidivorans DSM 14336 TaxID=999552 RepID=V9VVF2_9RHOB|nr:head-tail connector protein [Leisingera methylohalidivorans]AHD00857.1 gene transfer agent protein [Leisingera methylohalidivorans DSM 14336]